MIKRVNVKYFKRFDEETFELTDRIILAGPNNSGKSTLLQALAVWNLALRRWIESKYDSPAKERTAIPITRQQFTAIPLREMNHLWWNTSTALTKKELGDKHPGAPRLIEIEVVSSDGWEITMEVRYNNTEQVYVKPSQDSDQFMDKIVRKTTDRPSELKISVVHVPPFSGIGVSETGYDQGYKDMTIGQGKPGDVIRNLLLEVFEQGKEQWRALKDDILEIFGYELLDPVYGGAPFIQCDYIPSPHDERPRHPVLDIASAGSGFHQVLMLLAFFYARPASVLLLDEPDAHQHIVLQKQVFDRLRSVALDRNCQLIIATHSEVLIDGTDPQNILSFFRKPHILFENVERDRLREALKRVDSNELLLVENAKAIVYPEGDSDFNLLKTWAEVLDHAAKTWFHSHPLWRPIRGNDPRTAREHFFAIQAVNPDVKGLLLLDGDNRNLPSHETDAQGLTVLRWQRYEAESYLIHPESLRRFIDEKMGGIPAKSAMEYLRNQLPPVLFQSPFQNLQFIIGEPVSKSILPEMLRVAGIHLPRSEYYLIAKRMLLDEIHPDVLEILDQISKITEV